MRVVVDTNVLVSALIFPGGSPEEVYRLVLEQHIQLVSSPPLLAELGRVLVEKFGWAPEHAREPVEQVVRLAEVVVPRKEVTDIRADPADNRVLEAAAEGGASMIVSGDGHLLDLGSWRGIPIRTPTQILSTLHDS